HDRHRDQPCHGVLRDLPWPYGHVPSGSRDARLPVSAEHQRGPTAVNTRRLRLSLFFVALVVAGAIAGFVAGLRPQYGLDLVGGVSVTLEAPPNTPADALPAA